MLSIIYRRGVVASRTLHRRSREKCNPIKDRTVFESLEQLVGLGNYFVVGTLGLIAHCDKADHDTNPRNASLTDTRVAVVHLTRRKRSSRLVHEFLFSARSGRLASRSLAANFPYSVRKRSEFLAALCFRAGLRSLVRSGKLLLRNFTQRSLALIAASQISFNDKIIEEGQKQS